jgi:ABC-type Zn uptake system ZnuABC Zn-binding protein ZnuA
MPLEGYSRKMNGSVQTCGRSVKRNESLDAADSRVTNLAREDLPIGGTSVKRSGCLTLALVVAFAWSAAALRIVCTTTIVGDVVARIAGEGNELTVLLPVGADPHAFEPTPQNLVAIARADIVFLNGAGLERNLDPILENASGLVVALSDHLDLLRLDASDHEDWGHEEGHDGVDPHVWFDPTYIGAWVDLIIDTLSEQDPGGEPQYRARADAYRSELAELDAWIEDRLSGLPEERRRLVTDHAVFGYFAARYRFEQVGTVFPGLSSLSEPSARDLASLEEAIVRLGVPVLFIGTTVNRSLAEQIAADTGTRIVTLYTGSLSEPGGPAGGYLELMRYDVAAIVEGLSEAP